MSDKLRKLDFSWIVWWIDFVSWLEKRIKDDVEELIDPDFVISLLLKKINDFQKINNYEVSLSTFNHFFIKYKNRLSLFDPVQLAYVYEILWDNYLKLNSADQAMEAYNKSKKLWNLDIYKKISELYLFWHIDSFDNVEAFLSVYKRASYENPRFYSDYWYNYYIYRYDYERSISILEEWISKWDKWSIRNLLEVEKLEFFKKLNNLSSEEEKKEFISTNKNYVIEKINSYLTENKELFGILWKFYDDIWDYYNAYRSYSQHIFFNEWDISYHDNIWKLLLEHWEKIPFLTDIYIKLIGIYNKLLKYSKDENEPLLSLYYYEKLWDVHKKFWNRKESNFNYSIVADYRKNVWDDKLREDILRKLYDLSYNKEFIEDELLKLNPNKYEHIFSYPMWMYSVWGKLITLKLKRTDLI